MAIPNDEDWQLIALVLDGEMDEQDPLFLQWLASDKDHPALYKDLKQVKQRVGESHKYHQYESAKQEMWHRVQAEALKPQPVRRISSWWQYAAAAVILIVVLTIWLASITVTPKQPPIHIANNESADYVPQAKAILRLSDGSSVDLDKAKELKEKDGTHLTTAKTSGLRYMTDGSSLTPVYNTLVTAKGGAYQVTLADGTRVWLNAVSELTYPTKFSGEKREVELKGEAYFEVAKDASHPFIVKTATNQTLVTGTQFNIYAYPGEPALATLVEGGITFSGLNLASRPVKLLPSQQAVHEKANPDIKVKIVDTDLYTSWKQGGLFFENERLDILLRKLDRWYDFNVSFREPALKDLRFTGKADKTMSIEYILQLVSLTTKVKFNIEGKQVTVDNK